MFVSLIEKEEAVNEEVFAKKVETEPCEVVDVELPPLTANVPLDDKVKSVAPFPDPPNERYLTALSTVVVPKEPTLSVIENPENAPFLPA